MNDKKYEGYGFYWNANDKVLIINGEEHKYVSKAVITLEPNVAVNVNIDKLMVKPEILVQDEIELTQKALRPIIGNV